MLKQLILNGLTDTTLNIDNRGTKILAMTTFWNKCNFSAIIKHKGVKYYCYMDNKINDVVIENA
jgi:hypothetical protein